MFSASHSRGRRETETEENFQGLRLHWTSIFQKPTCQKKMRFGLALLFLAAAFAAKSTEPNAECAGLKDFFCAFKFPFTVCQTMVDIINDARIGRRDALTQTEHQVDTKKPVKKSDRTGPTGDQIFLLTINCRGQTQQDLRGGSGN